MKNLIIDGVPTLGTCAGLILLSKDILEGTVSLGLLDCIVERNAYGRQNESFEGLVDFNNNSQMYCFIRAPKIISTVGERIRYLPRPVGPIVVTTLAPIL